MRNRGGGPTDPMAASVAIARAGWRRLTPYEGAAAQALRRAWATAAATAAPTKPAENPGGGMPKAVRAVRGMPDYFGDDAAKLRAVENAGMRILQLAGYREVHSGYPVRAVDRWPRC